MAITGHDKIKTNIQNATRNEKHQQRASKNRFRAAELAAAYIHTYPQKENAPQSQKTPCKAKRKAANGQTVNG